MMENDSQPRVGSGWLALVVALCLLGLTAVFSLNRPTSTATNIVGTLNGQPFTREAFENELRFADLRATLANQAPQPVNKVALLNRMVGDALILQVARNSGSNTPSDAIDQEVASIISQFGLSEAEMRQQLAAHGLTWQDFHGSVGDYMTLISFLEEKLLADVPPDQQQDFLQNWMGTLLSSASIDFDEAFITEISSP
ncbi:MAG: SurA N-terminal domain-containing protein [Ardenticatenaceae bacterium]|nr:SurA N-terminal domain-containing protein [Ardenticatenaceae bacterium]